MTGAVNVSYDADGWPIITWDTEERYVSETHTTSFWGGDDTRQHNDTMWGTYKVSMRTSGMFGLSCKGRYAARINLLSLQERVASRYGESKTVGAEQSRAPYPNLPTDFYQERQFHFFNPDKITRFSMKMTSTFELSGQEAAALRAGKLMFIDHFCVIAEFDDGKELTFSRDCTSAQKTTDLVVALNTELVRKRPEGGWDAKYKKLEEVRLEQRLSESKKKRDAEFLAAGAKRLADDLAKQPAAVKVNGISFCAPTTSKVEDHHRGKMYFHPPLVWDGEQELAAVHVDKFAMDVSEISEETQRRIREQWVQRTPIDGQAIFSCQPSDGTLIDWAVYTQVTFHSDAQFTSGGHLTGMMTVYRVRDDVFENWMRPRNDVAGIDIFEGRTMKLPTTWFPMPDVVQSDDALILCIGFKNGDVIPLTYTTKTPRADLEAWKALLEMAWRKQSGTVPDAPPAKQETPKPISADHREV